MAIKFNLCLRTGKNRQFDSGMGASSWRFRGRYDTDAAYIHLEIAARMRGRPARESPLREPRDINFN